MAYHLQGSLLEVCNCNVLCPCWVGEDPDNGTCDTALAWRINAGTVEGIDVSGLTIGLAGHVPGNILNGNIRAVFFVDDQATAVQEAALVNVFSGKLGGPIADFAQLFGEIVSVERTAITFEVEKGNGRLQMGDSVKAELESFQGKTGQPTTLHDSVFSTIPGAPAYVGKASTFKMSSPALGLDIDLQGHNAIQGQFLFEG